MAVHRKEKGLFQAIEEEHRKKRKEESQAALEKRRAEKTLEERVHILEDEIESLKNQLARHKHTRIVR